MALEDEEPPKKKVITSHSSSHSSSSAELLPLEIIYKILLKLPVESLLRCKYVCKSWRSLISDPYFINYHLTLSTTNLHYSHHRLLVYSPVPVENLKTCPLSDVLYNRNPIDLLELDYPMKQSGKKVSIVGSCNGLVCITIDFHKLFIWNPSIRKSIQVPDSSLSDKIAGSVSHGFGYNESADDYKVVEIDGVKNMVMTYSSRNGNWKEIGEFPYFFFRNTSSVFLKGALHWIAIEYHASWSWSIVSLDLANETYSKALLPVDEDEDIDLKLGIVGDCLCVLCDYGRKSRPCADIWVMKDYGVKDSWFKLVSIPYDMESVHPQFGLSDQLFDWSDVFLAPLCVSDDGKVLIRLKSRLVVFDSKDGSTLEIQQFNESNEACTFVGSLVSPSGHANLI